MWILYVLSLFVIANVEISDALATASVNTNILTMFSYENHYVYVYSAVTNEHENLKFPERWSFFYVPIAMIPILRSSENSQSSSEWLTTLDNQIRVKILLGNAEITKLAREAIVRKFPSNMTQFMKSWDVSPLMIDTLTVRLIETGTGEAVDEISHSELPHPNGLSVLAILTCPTAEIAEDAKEKLLDEEYEIDVAFQFAGFRQTTTTFMSITDAQMKDVYKKTVADGGGNIATKYIHRSQMDQFSQKYLKNYRIVIYSEKDDNGPSQALVNGLMEKFLTLDRKRLLNAEHIRVNEMKKMKQIWSHKDLQPDQITREMNEAFKYNESETKKRGYKEKYFTVDTKKLNSKLFSGEIKRRLKKKVSVGVDVDLSKNDAEDDVNQELVIANLTTIKQALNRAGIVAEWSGNKFKPKYFSVLRLSNISKILEDSLFVKIQKARTKTAAINRKLLWQQKLDNFNNVLEPVDVSSQRLGKIWLFAGVVQPPLPWLLCDGRAVSRTKFQELFQMIGEKYGSGDGKTTFNLPDFRSRLPLGADPLKIHSKLATHLGRVGGKYVHIINTDELPRHQHDKGSLSLSPGTSHKHSINDGGHNHDGNTDTTHGNSGIIHSILCLVETANRGGEHYHSISRDFSNITILNSGSHSHQLISSSGSVGSNKPINVIGPYQVLKYVIYSGQTE